MLKKSRPLYPPVYDGGGLLSAAIGIAAVAAAALVTLALMRGAGAQELPARQQQFTQAVVQARDSYRAAGNEFQQGGVRQERKTALCRVMAGYDGAQWWFGTVAKLAAANDGRGVLAVTVADGVTLTTWNNTFADATDKTLIDGGTPLFKQAAALALGDRVWFRAMFRKDKSDCIKETSVTLDGAMTAPAFLVRFMAIQKAALDATGAWVAPPPAKVASAAPVTQDPRGSLRAAPRPAPAVSSGNTAATTTVQPLGQGAIVRRPGEPDAQVQPFGNGVIIHQPGKPTVQCSPLGNSTICR